MCPLSSQGAGRARRQLGVRKTGGLTGTWALKVAACLAAGDSGGSSLLPTPSPVSAAVQVPCSPGGSLLSDIICSQFP